ncbi:MAG: hypothetical protein ACLUA4_00395 [Bifidobacterium sp.]
MTYFQDADGRSYYAWQQLGATYIATMDPKDPAHVTSSPVRIVTPEYAWNAAIAEGSERDPARRQAVPHVLRFRRG